MACSLGFYGDGISFRVVFSQSFWLRVLPGGAHLLQPRWMPERRILGGGWTRGVSFWPFLNSFCWWWLISSVFPTRTSGHKTHANCYYGAWPGWAVSVSVLPLTISALYFFFFSWRLITLQYCSGFCHTLTWISHGFTCIPHPDPPSHLPLHLIPLGLPSAPGLSTCLMHPAWAGDLFHPR